ncbi:MAG: hypothetical protein LKG21_06860 [Ruminococcus sp.]|jgi:hypothetical protein|nr:hypothetical protein [Ruminococcus sp.]
MDLKSVMKGISIGTAAGVACYTLVVSGSKKKRSIKRNAGKALKAAGNVVDEITSMFM